MAETIFLLVVVGISLLLATSWMVHVLKFYALRALLTFFRFEKSTRNFTAKETWAAHKAFEIINQPKTKKGTKEWTS